MAIVSSPFGSVTAAGRAQALGPGQETRLERLRIDRRDHVAERVVAGNAARKGQETTQEGQMSFAPKLDLGEVVRPESVAHSNQIG
jgi:hypothetical protein